MQTIQEFIQNNNYNVSNLFVDKFWNSITDDKHIYIDNNMLEYIGYSNNFERDNKRHYTDLIKSKFIENEDYKQMNTVDFKNPMWGSTTT